MSEPQTFYKGYWMVTNRCNLNCSYCVLEDAPFQLKAELNLEAKKELISHLYEKLGFRRLTLSGGEVIIFGSHPPFDFMELLQHVKKFKSSNPVDNLEIELYTNGTYLKENVAEAMKGVVDTIAVTIDGVQNDFLSQLGRNHKRHDNYFQNISEVCKILSKNNIELKLHSVVCSKNHKTLPDELSYILNSLEEAGAEISYWKFFQYMSYDDVDKDDAHKISAEDYQIFKERTQKILSDSKPKLHFKNNKEMNDSLFNILSYGNAQYMRDGDTWTTSKRTEDLRTYSSMQDLFERHDINQDRFRQFHEIRR
jgi:MoaA/NifB/PqqE/SkfB family radical SAM enzyme